MEIKYNYNFFMNMCSLKIQLIANIRIKNNLAKNLRNYIKTSAIQRKLSVGKIPLNIKVLVFLKISLKSVITFDLLRVYPYCKVSIIYEHINFQQSRRLL
jgi:hypothetical protein